jgi:flagellar biosynthesis/type III secretory pathway protein FliH
VPGVGIEEDGRLAPGDVVVETEAGRIDARVETQLEALREALVEALR